MGKQGKIRGHLGSTHTRRSDTRRSASGNGRYGCRSRSIISSRGHAHFYLVRWGRLACSLFFSFGSSPSLREGLLPHRRSTEHSPNLSPLSLSPPSSLSLHIPGACSVAFADRGRGVCELHHSLLPAWAARAARGHDAPGTHRQLAKVRSHRQQRCFFFHVNMNSACRLVTFAWL